MPGFVKIGRSIHGGKKRAKDLYQTGVPTPFNLEFEILVEYPSEVEALAHESLAKFRVNGSREFFKVSVAEAREVIMQRVLMQYDMTSCGLDEYEAVEGAVAVAHKSEILWIDACHAVGWLTPEEITAAHQRRMSAISARRLHKEGVASEL